ncbi:type 1 glutamine amidotransferase domain-containing protein [Filimonas effusa]|uniref:type 1 glutamine amidotransferase domain-containing protein n=1 Tax=Filimonas effusa TaxID=2508721 RepID=UPI001FEB83FF|nr:type 1 glutamine amidotransferase domain-containing protein [Filimonas effusa]
MSTAIIKILIVLTSHSQLGNTGEKTGFWVEEFAAPYYALVDAGYDVTIASPLGGQPPIDPKSAAPESQTEATKRFYADKALQEKLAHSQKLSDVKESDYAAIFYPGGHGPLWDLTNDKHSIALIEAFYASGKPVAAVCHAPAVLLHAHTPSGELIISGKKVTGFSNEEEAAVKLTNVVPFLLEDELKQSGGVYSKGANWGSYILQDGQLITGQNPASSEAAAKALMSLLESKK